MDDWIFREAPTIDADIYLPADLYRQQCQGHRRAISSAAPWRVNCCGSLARSIPPLQPLVARLTTGVLFKFPIADVDDINALRPDFDVAGFYNAKNAIAAFRRITDPARSALSRGGLRL